MSLLTPFNFNSDRNEKHTAFDKQLLDEQKEWKKHYNPIKNIWRYKLIDKETKKYFRFTRIRKLGKYESFIDQFDIKYKYEAWPYKKRSIRKVYWFLILIWRNKLEISNNVFESKITKEIWIIIRSVLVLLLAYLLWAIFGDSILSLFH